MLSWLANLLSWCGSQSNSADNPNTTTPTSAPPVAAQPTVSYPSYFTMHPAAQSLYPPQGLGIPPTSNSQPDSQPAAQTLYQIKGIYVLIAYSVSRSNSISSICL